MTKKIYYEKVGRKYVPVSEYDSDFVDSFREGTHLIICDPNGRSRRFNVEPNYAAMIAAGSVAEDAISKVIMKATDMRPRNKPITPEQKAAWEHLVEVFGPEARALEWPSAREAAEEAVKAMAKEAEKLLLNESVRKAYDNFMLVAELSK